jgi:hypothetical protein
VSAEGRGSKFVSNISNKSQVTIYGAFSADYVDILQACLSALLLIWSLNLQTINYIDVLWQKNVFL